MTPLTEHAAQYAEERAPEMGGEVALQRAFMAGALAVASSKAPREQMLAECVQFGRVIGSAAELAAACMYWA